MSTRTSFGWARYLLLLALPVGAMENLCPRHAQDAEEHFSQASIEDAMESRFRRSDGGVLQVRQSLHLKGDAWRSSATFTWEQGQFRVSWSGAELRDAEALLRAHISRLPPLASLRPFQELTSYRWVDCSGSGTARSLNGKFFAYEQRWIDGSSFRCDERSCDCKSAPAKTR